MIVFYFHTNQSLNNRQVISNCQFIYFSLRLLKFMNPIKNPPIFLEIVLRSEAATKLTSVVKLSPESTFSMELVSLSMIKSKCFLLGVFTILIYGKKSKIMLKILSILGYTLQSILGYTLHDC